jgi:hypothetical protein
MQDVNSTLPQPFRTRLQIEGRTRDLAMFCEAAMWSQ